MHPYHFDLGLSRNDTEWNFDSKSILVRIDSNSLKLQTWFGFIPVEVPD